MVFAYVAMSATQKPRQPPTGGRAVYLHSLTAAFICSISGIAPPVQVMATLFGYGFSPRGAGGGPVAVRPPRPPPSMRRKTRVGFHLKAVSTLPTFSSFHNLGGVGKIGYSTIFNFP